MDSGDPKSPDKKSPAKSGGGLSASDLRARLGLKPSGAGGGSSASSLRARLGLEPISTPGSAPKPGPPGPKKPAAKTPWSELDGLVSDDSTKTGKIEESVLDMLRNEKAARRTGVSDAISIDPEPPAKEEEKEQSTHALSMDEFEDLLVMSGDQPAVSDEPENPLDELAADEDEIDDVLGGLGGDFGFGGEPKVEPPAPAAAVTAPAQQPSPEFLGASPSSAPIDEPLPDVNDLELEDSDEKTALLDTSMFEDEEEFDAFPDEEKTQIMMSAMDFDPLTGKLIVVTGEAPQREYVLARDKTTIGRGTKNGVVIPDIAMSRQHMAVERFAEGFVLKDLESGNGTRLNGRRIVYAELRSQDEIEIGNVKFRFEQSGGDPDELWKGEPKIEYHPKDQPQTARHAPAAPAGMSAAAPVAPQPPPGHISTGVIGPGGQQGFSHPMMNPAQGQYRAAAPWQGQPGMAYTGFPQAVHPGMMPRKKGSGLVTALIVFFSILLVGLVGLIVFSLVEREPAQQEKSAESEEDKKQRASQFVNEGLTFFEERRWDEARRSFQNALDLDPANQVAARYLQEFIPRDQAIETNIVQAMKAINNTATLDSYKHAILVLEGVSPESIFSTEVRNQHLPAVRTAYIKKLKKEAKRAMVSEEYVKARMHLRVIEKDLGVKDDQEVKDIFKRIKDKEARAKKTPPPPTTPQ